MTIDAAVVQERLRLIRELLDDLSDIGEVTASRLRRERITRHAVERIVTQLVDLSVAVNSHLAAALLSEAPATYRESFSAAARAGAISEELGAQLAPSAGLRNVLTHEYAVIDVGLVAASIPQMATGYRQYLSSVARFLATMESTRRPSPGDDAPS